VGLKQQNSFVLVGVCVFLLLVFSKGREDSVDVKPVSKSAITFSGGGGGGGSSEVAASLKVYSDASVSSELSNLDWGSLSPGENRTFTVYLVSNVDLSSVSVRALNAVPEDLFVFADFTGDNIALKANVAAPFSFTLSIHSDLVGISAFSFDVNFVGVS
jgi:hypothetical protein